MKLTKTRLKRIIKEEIGNLGEGTSPYKEKVATEVLQAFRTDQRFKYSKMLGKAIELVGGEEEFRARLVERASDLAYSGVRDISKWHEYTVVIFDTLEELL